MIVKYFEENVRDENVVCLQKNEILKISRKKRVFHLPGFCSYSFINLDTL